MITTVEIKTLKEVFLLAFQRKLESLGDSTMSFSELWAWVESSGSKLPQRVNIGNSRDIARELIWDLEDLQKEKLVWMYRNGKGHIINAGLTKEGIEYVKGIVFSHQHRAPTPETRAARGY
jgi:hypothetical protein